MRMVSRPSPIVDTRLQIDGISQAVGAGENPHVSPPRRHGPTAAWIARYGAHDVGLVGTDGDGEPLLPIGLHHFVAAGLPRLGDGRSFSRPSRRRKSRTTLGGKRPGL
jgi:hypothetical protein